MHAPDKVWAPMYGPFSTTQTLKSLPSLLLNCFNLIAADKPAGPLNHR